MATNNEMQRLTNVALAIEHDDGTHVVTLEFMCRHLAQATLRRCAASVIAASPFDRSSLF